MFTNSVYCREAGSTPAYSACSAATPACVAGTSCDGFPATLKCLPYCDSGPHPCPGDGRCFFILDEAGTVGLCFAPDDCDPKTGGPCNEEFGAMTCIVSDDTGATFCWWQGWLAAGATCSTDSECLAGYGCNGGPPTTCSKWCTTPQDCAAPASCLGIGGIPNRPTLGYCGGGAGGAGGAGAAGGGGGVGGTGGAGGTGGS